MTSQLDANPTEETPVKAGSAAATAGSAAALAADAATHDEVVDAGHKRLFGRGLLYVVVWSLQLLVSSVVSPFLAHLVTPAEFGAMASAMAIYQVLSVAAILGLDEALVLQRADDSHDPTEKSSRGLVTVAMALAASVTVIALATIPIWAPLVGLGSSEGLVAIVILWTFPSAANMIMISLLVAQDRLGPFMAVSGLSAVLGSLVGLILLVTVSRNIDAYAWGTVICQFIATGIGIYFVRPNLHAFKNWAITKKALKIGGPLAFSSLAYFVLNAGDRIIVQRDLGSIQVARYQVAYVIGSAVVILLNYTSGAWTPQFVALKNAAARLTLAMRSRDELYRLLVPIVLAVTLVSPLALRILAPSTFSPNGLTLVVYIVTLTAFPVAAGGACGRLLIVGRRAKTIGLLSAVAAIVNLGINIVLVPMMGIVGAALATLISYCLLAVLSWVYLPDRKQWHGAPPRLLASIFAVVLIAGLSMLIPETEFWNIVKAVVAVACLPWFLVRLLGARRGARVEAAPADDVDTDEPAAGAAAAAGPAASGPAADTAAAAGTTSAPNTRADASLDEDTETDIDEDARVAPAAGQTVETAGRATGTASADGRSDLDRLVGLFDHHDGTIAPDTDRSTDR